jgi:RNA polymerase sigma factor (sigma-70 family)
LNGTNREAQEIFYETYRKVIKDYLKHKYPKCNADDLDDCVSDILIKVFYNLNKYDSEKSCLKTWVLAITKNYMYDRNRKNCSNSGNTTNTGFGGITSTINTTGSINVDYNNSTTICCGNLSYISNTISGGSDFENCSSINYITSQLSPSDYTLLNMKYLQGYNYCEIGKEFQLSSSTVSNKINYIKTKLKKSMSEEMYD